MVRSILKSRRQGCSSSSTTVSFSEAHHSCLSSTPPLLPFTSSPPSPHVHFPPTPVIVSSFYIAHSSLIYDRAPIDVGPNSCALPERGGRVIMHAGSPPVSINGGQRRWAARERGEQIGSYFHPLAYEACEAEDPSNDAPVPSPSSIPQLVRDSSPSSSSESDEWMEGPYGSPRLSPIPPNVMSFLPHAGSRPPMKKSSGSRPKLSRRKTPTISRDYGCYSQKPSSEELPSLDDGCLGGF